MRPHLSVVIPAYNEEGRLGASLEKIAAYLKRSAIAHEMIVVDDGSQDRTGEIATNFFRGRSGKVITLRQNRGKGHALRQGFAQAQGRWILMTDADLSSPIEEHARLAEAARDRDLDIVIGSRGMAASHIELRQHPLREAMGKTFNAIIRASTGLSFRDTQCGFKLIDHDRVAPLFARMKVDRFAFDVELLFLASRFGLRIAEVPVVWSNDPSSRVNLVTDPLNMLLDVARVRWRFRRGGYNPATAADASEKAAGSGR